MSNHISLGMVLFIIIYIMSIELSQFKEKYDKVTGMYAEESKPEVLDVFELKFNHYLKDFNKSYFGEEYDRRFENFKASLKQIAVLNALEGNTVFGLTKFSDMSKEEFSKRMLLKPRVLSQCQNRAMTCEGMRSIHPVPLGSLRSYDDIPSSFDWRDIKGVVHPVLNQKQCLGCWAIAIVGVMESMAAIHLKEYESRSIQELIDCSRYTNGCQYGSVSRAMSFLCKYHLKINTEENYPLKLVTGACKKSLTHSGRMLKNFTHHCKVKETDLVGQVREAPVIAAVHADNWMNYIGGVIWRACQSDISNHVIQIVGYHGFGDGSETDPPYYIIKNSWGDDFGDNGYVKVRIGGNICGIADQVSIINVM